VLFRSIQSLNQMNRNGQNPNNFSFKNIVKTAGELAHTNFAYLILRKENKSYDVAASYGMEGMDLKLISAPLLNQASKETSILINDAHSDPRLQSNKIIQVTTQVVLKITAVNVLFQPANEFKIEQYHEFRCGDFGSLVLMDKEPTIVTARQTSHLAAIAELITRQLTFERRLVDMKQKTIDEVSVDLVSKSEKLNTILNCMTQGIIIKSRQGEVIECNPAAKQILGSMARDFGTNIMRAVNKDGSPMEYEDDPFRVASMTGKPKLNVLMGLHKNADIVWINVNAFPMSEKGKSTQNILITILDVTEMHNNKGGSSLLADDNSHADDTKYKIAGTESVAPPLPVKDEVADENDLLFAMLNAISVDDSAIKEPEIQFVHRNIELEMQ